MFPLAHLGGALALAFALERLGVARFDYRWVLLGGMLPDLIDKTIGHGIFHGTVDDGRLMCHTLVVTAALAAAAGWRPRPLLIGLAVGFCAHLALDGMWMDPETFLYPAYGLSFPIHPYDPALWLHTLLTDRLVQLGEALGAAAMLAFACWHGILRPAGMWRFIRRGELPAPRGAEARTGPERSATASGPNDPPHRAATCTPANGHFGGPAGRPFEHRPNKHI